jgi:hypothetical protein
VDTQLSGFVSRATKLYLSGCLMLASIPVLSQSDRPNERSAGNAKSAAAPAKLTPEQERGLRLLKATEAEAAGLAPDLRAFVLWRAAYAYAVVDAKKAQAVTKEAYVATQAIEDPSDSDQCGPIGSAGDIKSWIQGRIFNEMINKDRIQEVEEMLPQATEPVRDDVTTQLVQHYVSKNDLAHALALLTPVAETKHYPFGAAADLLLAFGPAQAADRMTIFAQALNNFEQNAGASASFMNDFGTFIGRTWDHVPSAVVLEAVDKVLDQAKSKESHDRVSMATDKGFVTLNSNYEVRLFQLLPVIEELDKDKAESLLRENAAMRERLAKYPKGMQSLNSPGVTYSYGVTSASDDDSPGAAQSASQEQAREQAMQQITRRINEIGQESEKDPQQAINDTLMLPMQDASQNSSPRANALLLIARNTQQRKPSAAKSALDEIMKFEDQLNPAQVRDLADVPTIYLDIAEADGAKKALKFVLKAAEQLYAHDTDADDPNKSFKGTWPSADLWRKCLQVASKISPVLAEEIMSEIPDPEIAASIKVAYAAGLLGQTSGVPILVSECRKTGSSYNFSN